MHARMRDPDSSAADATAATVSVRAEGVRVAIVVSRYHEAITGALRQGAVEAFTAAGGATDDLRIVDAPGAFELTNFMLVLIVFFSIGYTLIRQGHISIDVVVSHFSPRTQAVIDCITYFLSLGLFSLVTWQSAVYAGRLFEGHNISGVLSLPIYIFVIAAAFGSLLFCLVLLVNILSSLAKAVQHES